MPRIIINPALLSKLKTLALEKLYLSYWYFHGFCSDDFTYLGFLLSTPDGEHRPSSIVQNQSMLSLSYNRCSIYDIV